MKRKQACTAGTEPASSRRQPDRHEAVRRRLPNVLFVTSELADYVKVGGLGDVSAALPRALRKRCDVRVLIPAYREFLAQNPALEMVTRLPGLAGIPECSIGRTQTSDGVVVYAVICPELYEREGSPYLDPAGNDWTDNDLRFARLGLAAADLARGMGDPNWIPDLLHLNDWTSALAPAYLRWSGHHTPTVLTIHNLAYRGLFGAQHLDRLGIPPNAFHINGVEFCGDISFLKAGIFYASHVTTVSSTYACEITTPEHGCGLHGLLQARAKQGRLTGILNGIDESWDPSRDRHLARPFGVDDWAGKQANAQALRQEFGLAVSRGPLFAVVSRLVHQKGLDVALQAVETIVRQGGQIVITGRGERQLENSLGEVAKRYPGKVGVKIGYEEKTARRMLGGSDFLLMPSRFEPCGLVQMQAQRFGSLPVAHRTGGLADTIEDGVTGVLFDDFTLVALLNAVYRSMDIYHSPRRLKSMRQAAMSLPCGWGSAAASYAKIYGTALSTSIAA